MAKNVLRLVTDDKPKKFAIRNFQYVVDETYAKLFINSTYGKNTPLRPSMRLKRFAFDMPKPWRLTCPNGDIYWEKTYDDAVMRMNNVINGVAA